MTPTTAPGKLSPTSTVGVGASESSRRTRSGLKSPGRTTTPPLAVRTEALAPPSPTTEISPKALEGPVATGLLSWSRMPSRLSQKSMPSLAASSSITSVGGTRPPVPTTVGAGSGLPDDSTVTDGPVISVVVRLVAPSAPPGRNSDTRPPTTTASPTATVGAEELNTNSPSEVAGSASGLGSWNQKPLVVRAVTIPETPATTWPLRGETWLAPWMSWIAVGTTTLTVSVQVAVCGAGSSLLALTVTA